MVQLVALYKALRKMSHTNFVWDSLTLSMYSYFNNVVVSIFTYINILMLFQYLQGKQQHEEGPIRAVIELCDGNPSEETQALLRSPDWPVEHLELTRLYGTNFDRVYINQIMLEEMDGNSHMYKAVDEGNSKLMRCTALAKNIALKAGAQSSY